MMEQDLNSLRALGRAFGSDNRILEIEYKDFLPVANSLWEAALICDQTTNCDYYDSPKGVDVIP